ncbi:hypothetical protein C1J02_02870 [Sulfitobacter sp. SK011]|nr:hypothetical protein C1J02_02870 [Sulfitobacter sp. SK011]
MSGFKRFFLRSARKPFWERGGQTSEWPGLMQFLSGLLCLGIAYVWANAILTHAAPLIGNLAGKSDWFWAYAEVAIKTGIFWIAGLFLVLIGGVQLLFVLAAKSGERIAKRVLPNKKKDV